MKSKFSVEILNILSLISRNFSSFKPNKVSPLILDKGIAGEKYIEALYNKHIRYTTQSLIVDGSYRVILSISNDPEGERLRVRLNTLFIKQVWEFYFKRAPKLKTLLSPETFDEYSINILSRIISNINIKTLINSVKKFKITDDSSVHDLRGVLIASIIDSHTHDIGDLCELYGYDFNKFLSGNISADEFTLVKKILNTIPSFQIGRFSKTIVKYLFNRESSIWKDGTIYLLDNAESIINTLEMLNLETKPSEERFKGIALEFSRWNGYDQDDQDKAERWMEMSVDRKYTSIPYINIEKDGYVMYKLSEDDPRALTLGEHTDCCQYIGGAGNSCVKYGMTQPNAGFYVIEKKGGSRILSQAFVWRYEDTLVFDNVETLGGGRFKDMWKNAAREIVKQNKMFIKSVIVGMGHNDEFTGKDGNIKNTPTEMLKVLGNCYTDARTHIILK